MTNIRKSKEKCPFDLQGEDALGYEDALAVKGPSVTKLRKSEVQGAKRLQEL